MLATSAINLPSTQMAHGCGRGRPHSGAYRDTLFVSKRTTVSSARA